MEENHCIQKGIEQLFNNGTNRHLIQVVDKSCGMRIICGIPPSGSHPTWTADGSHPIWAVLADLRTGYFSGPCYVALGRSYGSHRRGRGFDPLRVHQKRARRTTAVRLALVRIRPLLLHHGAPPPAQPGGILHPEPLLCGVSFAHDKEAESVCTERSRKCLSGRPG